MTKTERQEVLHEPITVAILGSGGREHALATKISQSRLCRKVVVLPGNPGMTGEKIEVCAIDFSDHHSLIETLEGKNVELVVIGPDDLLAEGLTDKLEAAGLAVFGPSKEASRIEWSKAFAKEIMDAAKLPTAKFKVLGPDEAGRMSTVAAELGGFPVVLKYDGLALGKGVRICANETEAEEFLADVFEKKIFARADKTGAESTPVLAEQFLRGHEVSLFALCDGETWVPLDPACDHKRLLDGNKGPNTGGMGAYSPVPWLVPAVLSEIRNKIFPSILAVMREHGVPFKGLLYAGLMVQGKEFQVLEFNARFGDPETQALLPRMESDLLPLLYGAACGRLERHCDLHPPRWSAMACVTVVAASRGYPSKPETGFEIVLDDSKAVLKKGQIYFAGVKSNNGSLKTAGGRVFAVSSLGRTLENARELALGALEHIRFEGMHFRKDIAGVGSRQ